MGFEESAMRAGPGEFVHSRLSSFCLLHPWGEFQIWRAAYERGHMSG